MTPQKGEGCGAAPSSDVSLRMPATTGSCAAPPLPVRRGALPSGVDTAPPLDPEGRPPPRRPCSQWRVALPDSPLRPEPGRPEGRARDAVSTQLQGLKALAGQHGRHVRDLVVRRI